MRRTSQGLRRAVRRVGRPSGARADTRGVASVTIPHAGLGLGLGLELEPWVRLSPDRLGGSKGSLRLVLAGLRQTESERPDPDPDPRDRPEGPLLFLPTAPFPSHHASNYGSPQCLGDRVLFRVFHGGFFGEQRSVRGLSLGGDTRV